MSRVLLLLLAAVMLLVVPAYGPAGAPGVSRDDCCPGRDEPVDCCDIDLGSCTAPHATAPSLPAPLPPDPSAALPEDRGVAQLHLYWPRDNGPPPTPPPIG